MSNSAEGPGIKFASEERKREVVERSRRAVAFFRSEILKRHEQPRDDFLSELVQLHVGRDGGLDIRYLAAEATNLFSAGNLTTGHMLASTLLAMLERPEHLAVIVKDAAHRRLFIEESLRLESPVQWVQRLVKEDTELAGVTIPEGSIVFIVFGSGDRDDSRFVESDSFDPYRRNLIKDHLAFGRGSHRCVGAPLARLEGEIAFQELLTQLPDLRVADGDAAVVRSPSPSGHFRGLKSLWIEFDVPS
jgi:cytochrome P450